jgi:hypothetical protein
MSVPQRKPSNCDSAVTCLKINENKKYPGFDPNPGKSTHTLTLNLTGTTNVAFKDSYLVTKNLELGGAKGHELLNFLQL